MKLSIEQQLEELAKHSGIYKRNTEHLMENLNMWRGSKGDPTEFRMLIKNMVKIFHKKQIKLVHFESSTNPYEAQVTVHGMTIAALVDHKEIKEYFPEKIQEQIQDLEKQLAEYRRAKHESS